MPVAPDSGVLSKKLAASLLKSRQKAAQETQAWKRKAEELSLHVQSLTDTLQGLSRIAKLTRPNETGEDVLGQLAPWDIQEGQQANVSFSSTFSGGSNYCILYLLLSHICTDKQSPD
jgi:hypothetical protein